MKRSLFKIFFVFTLVFFHWRIVAQDFHLSHYDANPIYLNPALTGMRFDLDWNYRAVVNYREQGGKYLGGSNTTFAAALDKPINNKFSIGEFIVNDRTVNGSFNTFNFMLSTAYRIIHESTNGADKHNLSVGLQMGILQKSIYPADFVYDSQYSPSSLDGFDRSLSTNENFKKESYFRFDANMGVFYKCIDASKKYFPFGGLAIYHITQANKSFFGETYKTPIRYVVHGGCENVIGTGIKIQSQLLYMNQAKANELNLQVVGYYKLEGTDYEPLLGLAWRNKDAVILHLGLKQKNNIYRLSYDINTSYQKLYSNGRGGFEVSVLIAPGKKRAEESPALPEKESLNGLN